MPAGTRAHRMRTAGRAARADTARLGLVGIGVLIAVVVLGTAGRLTGPAQLAAWGHTLAADVLAGAAVLAGAVWLLGAVLGAAADDAYRAALAADLSDRFDVDVDPRRIRPGRRLQMLPAHTGDGDPVLVRLHLPPGDAPAELVRL